MGRAKPIRVFRDGRKQRAQLDDLVNLGPRSAAWLRAAGLHTREELARLGAVEACRRVEQTGQRTSLLLAYAIEGALTGVHWNALSPDTRQWLRAEYGAMKRQLSS